MNDTAQIVLTALDKALEKTKPDVAPLTSAFLTELRRQHPTTGGMGTLWTKRNWPEGLLFQGRMVEATPRTNWAIFADSGEGVCTEEEFDQLRALQERMEKISADIEKYSLSNITAYQVSQRDQLEADALAGNMPSGVVLRSREGIAEDFRAKQGALMKILVKITHEEVVPLAKPVLLAFEKIVENFLRNVEERERSICEGFGIEYQPSVLWQAAVTVAMRYTADGRLPRPSLSATPRSLLAGIIEI